MATTSPARKRIRSVHLLAAIVSTGRRLRQLSSLPEKWYSVAEIAHALGFSEGTVITWIKGGSLVGVKINRQWRVSEADYTAFLKSKYGDGSAGK